MTKKLPKRILAVIVSIAMLLALSAPMQAFAVENEAVPLEGEGTVTFPETDPFADETPSLKRWVQEHQRAPVLWSAIKMQEDAQEFSELEAQVAFLKDNVPIGEENNGYEFFVLDGWLRDYLKDDTNTKMDLGNGNGYPRAPYGEWVKDGKYYTDFVKLCTDNGLKPGVYWNPAWIIRSDVVDENGDFRTDTTVWGTDIPLSEIVRKNSDGSMASGQDPFMGYVDLEADGAEEFIKGCIHWYRAMGVCYQKVDFVPTQFNQYGKEGLEKLYRWIREAAGPDYVFSISMAPSPNYGELEFEYGDLVRVSVDTGNWETFSSRNRGVIHPNAYCNAFTVFDGFNYFAEKAREGPKEGYAMMDGDESRSNSLTVEEVKSVVSLKVLSGNGIQFSDIYSETEGDGTGSVGTGQIKPWAFTNQAMLDLAYEGFFAKPLKECEKPDVTAILGGDPWAKNNHWTGGADRGISFTLEDTDDPKTQILAGQCENGDWIVGLFNREDSARARSFDLKEDLGLDGQWNMTDLWAEEADADLGVVTGGWSTVVPAHGCRIVRLSEAKVETPYALVTLDQDTAQLDTKTEDGKNVVTLTANIEKSEGYPDVELVWESSDATIASVVQNADGKTAVVTGLKEGIATITVKENKTGSLAEDSCEVTVQRSPDPMTNGDSLYMEIEQVSGKIDLSGGAADWVYPGGGYNGYADKKSDTLWVSTIRKAGVAEQLLSDCTITAVAGSTVNGWPSDFNNNGPSKYGGVTFSDAESIKGPIVSGTSGTSYRNGCVRGTYDFDVEASEDWRLLKVYANSYGCGVRMTVTNSEGDVLGSTKVTAGTNTVRCFNLYFRSDNPEKLHVQLSGADLTEPNNYNLVVGGYAVFENTAPTATASVTGKTAEETTVDLSDASYIDWAQYGLGKGDVINRSQSDRKLISGLSILSLGSGNSAVSLNSGSGYTTPFHLGGGSQSKSFAYSEFGLEARIENIPAGEWDFTVYTEATGAQGRILFLDEEDRVLATDGYNSEPGERLCRETTLHYSSETVGSITVRVSPTLLTDTSARGSVGIAAITAECASELPTTDQTVYAKVLPVNEKIDLSAGDPIDWVYVGGLKTLDQLRANKYRSTIRKAGVAEEDRLLSDCTLIGADFNGNISNFNNNSNTSNNGGIVFTDGYGKDNTTGVLGHMPSGQSITTPKETCQRNTCMQGEFSFTVNTSENWRTLKIYANGYEAGLRMEALDARTGEVLAVTEYPYPGNGYVRCIELLLRGSEPGAVKVKLRGADISNPKYNNIVACYSLFEHPSEESTEASPPADTGAQTVPEETVELDSSSDWVYFGSEDGSVIQKDEETGLRATISALCLDEGDDGAVLMYADDYPADFAGTDAASAAGYAYSPWGVEATLSGLPEGRSAITVYTAAANAVSQLMCYDDSGRLLAAEDYSTEEGAFRKWVLYYSDEEAGGGITFQVVPKQTADQSGEGWAGIAAITVSAPHTLTVVDGTDLTGAEEGYLVGEEVKIKADAAPAGQTFDKWVSEVGSFANAAAEETTFTMPDSDATVTATYKSLPPVVEVPDPETPSITATGLDTTNHFAYIKGYKDGTVRPGENITRAEVATIFYRLMEDSYRSTYWTNANEFNDVDPESWYNNAVSTAASAGLIRGYGDGSFKGNRAITRAEFATIASQFIPDVKGNVEDYPDTANHWAAQEIRIVTEAGWFIGDKSGFRPNDPITRAEAMTVVNRMVNRVPREEDLLDGMVTWKDNEPGKWYYTAVQEATNSHGFEHGERDGVTVESWLELLPDRDWAALEKEWEAEHLG